MKSAVAKTLDPIPVQTPARTLGSGLRVTTRQSTPLITFVFADEAAARQARAVLDKLLAGVVAIYTSGGKAPPDEFQKQVRY